MRHKGYSIIIFHLIMFRFIENEVAPLFDDIYRGLRPLMQFYLNPKHFKRSHMNVEAAIFLKSYM